MTRTSLSRSKGQRSTCRDILWRPPTQLVGLGSGLVKSHNTEGKVPVRTCVLQAFFLPNNNKNNNNRIYIAPCRNFRGAGGRSDQCSMKAWVNKKKVFKSRFKNRESPIRTVCDSEFQTDGAENRKARLEKSVLGQQRDSR